MAAGAKVVKMARGHRGHNLPVKEEGGSVFISRQSHGYVVDEGSLAGTDLAITHRNLNDGTVEGLKASPFAGSFRPVSAPHRSQGSWRRESFVSLPA